MCTKEKVYKWVFSVGIYAWIIFKDDDGGKDTVSVNARFPNLLKSYRSTLDFGLCLTSQNKNITENPEVTQQIHLFTSLI